MMVAGAATLLGWAGGAGAQISPGPLARAHQSLDVTTGCFQCHAKSGGAAAMDARCLSCHTEIQWLRDRKRGFHAGVREACAKCHPDHAGRDFALIAWDGGSPERFDHRRAGWLLEGKHAGLSCRSCHRAQFQRTGAAGRIRKADRSQSWLGLETACASCHVDPHQGRLDTRCETCHDMRGWKPAPRFDHARTAFPLTGKHAAVACIACHTTGGLATAHDAKPAPMVAFGPVAHDDCSSCHRDPHAGRFGAACARCHASTTSFRMLKAGGFDHDRTRYPLRGRHASVACAACHVPGAKTSQRPSFGSCNSCHSDPHGGQATVAGVATDCASCHTVQGFTPSTFTVAQHTNTEYPLLGAHANVRCGQCHTKQSTRTTAGAARIPLRPAHDRCASCHRDPHAGRFSPGSARGRKGDCLDCHTMNALLPARYDAAMHATAEFRLEGAHRAVACAACHGGLAAAASTPARARALAFQDERRACANCHAGVHGKQFDERPDRGACQACHGQEAFTPATRFDHHTDSRFRLEGVHERIPCASCHPSRRGADGTVSVVYRPIPHRCEDCHAPAR
jgi:hypothetical protein